MLSPAKTKKTLNKKKVKKISIFQGIVNCHFSQNNTLANFCKDNGECLFWCSGGKLGFKGTKKSTSYVAQKVIEEIINWIVNNEVKEIVLNVKKIGLGRDVVLREFIKCAKNGKFFLKTLIDSTPIKFGGTRSRKKPRK